MASIITRQLRNFTANQFVNALSMGVYKRWVAQTAISTGDIVISNNFKYRAGSSGVTGTNAPTHTIGSVSDGSISFLAIEPYINNSTFHNSLYIAIGKSTDWESEPDPDTPLDNDAQVYGDLSQIIALKKISATDLRLGIPKYTWVSGTIYDHYDPNVDVYTHPFYTINSSHDIYKCIWNAGGDPSVSEPIGTPTTGYVYAADGYVWKYMGSVSSNDAIRFITQTHIPITQKRENDGSAQWDIQNNARVGSISYIKVLSGGTGYTTASVEISGSPTVSATATVHIGVTGIIEYITITNFGEGYFQTPDITITGDGTGATAEAILAPLNGHGYNAPVEIGVRSVICSIILEGNVGGYFPVSDGDNEVRNILFVADPKDTSNHICSQSAYIGPVHPEYSTTSLHKVKPNTGIVLHKDYREKLTRNVSTKEEFRIVFNF